MSSDYTIRSTWAMGKRILVSASLSVSMIFFIAFICQPLLKYLMYLTLSPINYLSFSQSYILEGILWLSLCWSAMIIQGYRFLTHHINISPFYANILYYMIWSCSISVIIIMGYILSYSSNSSSYDISSLLLLFSLSSAMCISEFHRESSCDKTSHIDYIQRTNVPLTISYAWRNEVMHVMSRSLRVVISSLPRSLACYTVIAIIITGRFNFDMSLFPIILTSITASLLSLWIICPLTAAIHVIINNPIDFTKLNTSSTYDYITSAICSGPYKPSHRAGDTLLSAAMSKDLSVPYWHDIQLAHKDYVDKMLESVSATTIGRPILPVLSSDMWISRMNDSLVRSLSYQDLARLVRGSYPRRKVLFTEKKWIHINFSLCAFIDAVTLQLQLDTAYMMVEINSTSSSMNSKSSTVDATSAIQVTVNTSMDIVQQRKQYRENKNILGMCMKKLLHVIPTMKYKSLDRRLTYAIQSILGIEAIFHPISPAMMQDMINAIEAMTINIVSARHEDPYGLTQQYLPSMLYTLSALDIALKEYGQVIRDVFATQRVRYIDHYRQLKSVGGSYIAPEIQALAIAVDEGLNRLVRVFYDVIPKYPFPAMYTEALAKRLLGYHHVNMKKK